jgi:hypothetical protein
MIKRIKRIIKKLLFYIDKALGKEFCEFHDFPFNEMQPFDPIKGEEAMFESSQLLKRHNIDYRITDGTVLGLYRNNQFIPHDNDIDIDILDINDDKEFIKLICNVLNYKVGRIVYFKREIQQIAFFNSNKIVVDFIFWHKKETKIFNFQENGYSRIQESKYFINLDSLNFNNRIYPIPGFIEEWLNFRYGSDWKTPKTYKGDWKEESGDINKL